MNSFSHLCNNSCAKFCRNISIYPSILWWNQSQSPEPCTNCVSNNEVVIRVVLDSWVVSQIWLDSDSNESNQSRVGRENPGYESSQSRITLIVMWVRIESTGYCLSRSWVTDFSKRKRQDLAIICNFTEKEPTCSYIRPHPPPPVMVNNFFPN